ncbi:unnamed protein product [marine sediment metagenome]|uniref:Uncharacterized protein n=1 Tax=marine sediment metagenome TaxID=412755 RepID=X0W8W2_9ZZZZ
MMNPAKIIEKAVGGSKGKLADILESIHGRLEVMNEQQGKILDVLERVTGIKGEYKDEDDVEETVSESKGTV